MSNIDRHNEWMDNSPGGATLREHGIDWRDRTEPGIRVAVDSDADADYPWKFGSEVQEHYMKLYDGSYEEDEDWGTVAEFVSLPTFLVRTLEWERDEACGWGVIS